MSRHLFILVRNSKPIQRGVGYVSLDILVHMRTPPPPHPGEAIGPLGETIDPSGPIASIGRSIRPCDIR